MTDTDAGGLEAGIELAGETRLERYDALMRAAAFARSVGDHELSLLLHEVARVYLLEREREAAELLKRVFDSRR